MGYKKGNRRGIFEKSIIYTFLSTQQSAKFLKTNSPIAGACCAYF
ncbi:hypothetical protein SAMN04515668_2593 [Hymenobacter arizonensis]|uniref:Uncharacterized protein n=1 Tax=Hymenobacter arizonensis TaxID=1227077 RepID=A0A1I5Z0W2_HYMAR|nr:hypothetical protein SAMN04515668_2593 [Hymenobacter arizonensis]